MRYLTPQMRNAIRGLGWGGMAQYAVLRGASASLRLKSRQPEFLLAVPNNAQAESYYTVVSLAVRKNNSREIMVGGGYMGYSTGVATDRIVATASEKLSDQVLRRRRILSSIGSRPHNRCHRASMHLCCTTARLR